MAASAVSGSINSTAAALIVLFRICEVKYYDVAPYYVVTAKNLLDQLKRERTPIVRAALVEHARRPPNYRNPRTDNKIMHPAP